MLTLLDSLRALCAKTGFSIELFQIQRRRLYLALGWERSQIMSNILNQRP